MILDDGDHLMASAGDPQTEPGPQCQHLSRPLRPAEDRHGFLTDWCAGCYSLQPVHKWLALIGVRRIPAHDPAPPQHHVCWVCQYPLREPSYTWAPHKECSQDGPHDVWAEGYEPAPADW